MIRKFSQSIINSGVCLALLVLVYSGCQLMLGTKAFDEKSTAKVESGDDSDYSIYCGLLECLDKNANWNEN